MIKRFSVADRDKSMTQTVSFHGAPMFRGLAFAIRDIEAHGAPVDIFSADRRDSVIAEHNRDFNTTLHGQQFLYDHQGQPGYNPANPPSETSHCLRADATIAAVLAHHGIHVQVGDRIPWHALGIDLADKGQREDVRAFLHAAATLGYRFVQPYAGQGKELHHVICVESPVPVLERRNQISKARS